MRDPLFWDYLKSDFQSQLWSATVTLIYFAYIIWHDITAVARFCGDIIVCLLSDAQWHAIVFKSNHATKANKLPLANPQNWMWMEIVPLRDQYCSRFFFKILPRAEATNRSSLPQVTVTVPDDAPPGTVLAIPIRGSISAWWDLPFVDFQWHIGHNVFVYIIYIYIYCLRQVGLYNF